MTKLSLFAVKENEFERLLFSHCGDFIKSASFTSAYRSSWLRLEHSEHCSASRWIMASAWLGPGSFASLKRPLCIIFNSNDSSISFWTFKISDGWVHDELWLPWINGKQRESQPKKQLGVIQKSSSSLEEHCDRRCRLMFGERETSVI